MHNLEIVVFSLLYYSISKLIVAGIIRNICDFEGERWNSKEHSSIWPSKIQKPKTKEK